MTVRSAISLGVLLLFLAAGVALFRSGSVGTRSKPVEPPRSNGVRPEPDGIGISPDELALPDPSSLQPASPGQESTRVEQDAGERSALEPNLESDRTAPFVVRVLDETELPVEGVPVDLVDTDGNQYDVGRMSEAGGEVLFPRSAVRAVKKALDANKSVLARAGVLSSLEVTQKIDAEVLKSGALELVVPSHGSVRVTVLDVNGATFAKPATVSLGFVRDDESINTERFSVPRESTVEQELSESGQAFFPVVELDGLLELRVTREGSSVPTRAIVTGPIVAGSTTDVPLTWGSDHAVLRFRVIEQGGAPLVNTKLIGRFATRFMGFWDDRREELTTSPDGTLEVDLSNNWVEGNERRLDLELYSQGSEAKAVLDLQGTVDLGQAFPAGLTVLDDVQMLLPPIFVGGKVIDVDGRPQEKAKLVLEAFEGSRWTTRTNYNLASDSEGNFQAFRQEPGEKFRLTAEVEGLVGASVEFEPGQSDLVLEMLPGGMISGKVLFGNGIESDSIRLQLRLKSDHNNSGPPSTEQTTGEVESNGSFEFAGLATGSYSLRVLPSRGYTELWIAEGIEVQPGVDLRDPRLNPIDLRNSVFMHRVTLNVPEGAEISSGQLNSGPAGSEALKYSLWFNRSTDIEVLGADSIDLVVSAEGFRVEHAYHVSGDLELDLRPAPQIRLRVDGVYTLPEPPFYVRPMLVKMGSQASPSGNWDSPALDARREVVIPAQEPGLCEVRWLVQRQGDGVGIGMISKSYGQQVNVTDSDTEQSASIVLTQEQLDEILAQMK